MKSIKPKSAKYFIGEKTGYSALKLMTGTDQGVGPGKYRPETAKYHSHHPKFPIRILLDLFFNGYSSSK